MEDEHMKSRPESICDTSFRRACTDTLSEIDHYWSDVLNNDEVLDDLFKLHYVV